MDFQRERRVDNGVGGQHQNFKLAFCRQKRKRLFNTRLSHSPPTPPLTLPLLKDKEPSLAAVGPCLPMTTGILLSPPWSDLAPFLFLSSISSSKITATKTTRGKNAYSFSTFLILLVNP
ncbi:hypothetical protein RHMOL_Rhmol04G0162000 [Rhododendron molle]|uniref:Uncharacterized protein n=1 Tax=Rhododendron molle TaxID=49168 RepID=A0ACC0P2C5_RHOML|nr:hypothetical protein RHMOL_Rhmol04G0162000 [Rhododendron molle]